jgi:hypothetical protein
MDIADAYFSWNLEVVAPEAHMLYAKDFWSL